MKYVLYMYFYVFVHPSESMYRSVVDCLVSDCPLKVYALPM